MLDHIDREIHVWDAGYALGYQHATEGRASILPCTECEPGGNVVELLRRDPGVHRVTAEAN